VSPFLHTELVPALPRPTRGRIENGRGSSLRHPSATCRLEQLAMPFFFPCRDDPTPESRPTKRGEEAPRVSSAGQVLARDDGANAG